MAKIKISNLSTKMKNKLFYWKKLHKQKKLPFEIYNKFVQENMLHLLEGVPRTSPQISKNQLLDLAKNGMKRPSRKTSLGNFLSHCFSKKHSLYNPFLIAELKQLRPDWFKESKKKMYIEQLFELIRVGQKRPSQNTKLGTFLVNLCSTTHYSYDPIVSAEIKQLRPDWFRQ